MRPRSNALLHPLHPCLHLTRPLDSCLKQLLLSPKVQVPAMLHQNFPFKQILALPSATYKTQVGMIIGENFVLILLNRHVVPTQSLYKQLFMIIKSYYYRFNKVAFENYEVRIISSCRGPASKELARSRVGGCWFEILSKGTEI